MKRISLIFLVITLVCAMALSVSAKEIKFQVMTDEEANYIYDEYNASQEAGGRFHDAEGYIVYEFAFDKGDTYAELKWVVGNQFEISVSKTGDDDSWEVIDTATKKDTDTEPNWGCIGRIKKTHDLSKWTQDNEGGKIYVRMADCDKDGGWGGYLYAKTDIVFTSAPAAPAAETTPPVEVPPAPAPTPVDGPNTPAPSTDPVPAAPQTSDAGIAAAIMLASAAAAVVIAAKKSR